MERGGDIDRVAGKGGWCTKSVPEVLIEDIYGAKKPLAVDRLSIIQLQ